ncbi:PilX N-terminal domain-containing pilus assembly protein [Halomonas sp. A29]|uniref:PilX N-terminal domain-containing pilus assembly protein n=1 Tax=Halomonas sp. A29 TaxID=3102786 RepID=UPI00398B6C1D
MHQQHGAALVVVLSLLTLSLMLGLSGYQSALVDERLAGNYRAATEAQMGAEHAVSAAWGEGGENLTAGHFSASIGLDALESTNWATFSGISQAGPCQGNVRCRYRYVREGGSYYVVGMGAVTGGNQVVASSLPVVARVEFREIPNPSFTRGLLSAGHITVTGNSTLTPALNEDGSINSNVVHANGLVSISVPANQRGYITSGADRKVEVPLPGTRPTGENMSQCTGASPPDYCYKRYDPTIYDEYRNRPGVIRSCNINLNTLPHGSTVFCEGNLSVGSGSVEGKQLTLVATGDVSMSGSTTTSGPGAAEIGLFVVAGGNINFSGSTDNYGVFWAGGHVSQSGTSRLHGSIVAGSYIQSSGGIRFTSINRVTNRDAYIETEPRIVSWR